ncbi:hypothetical protein HK097_003038, partial [Rhizophlyctis rosea]
MEVNDPKLLITNDEIQRGGPTSCCISYFYFRMVLGAAPALPGQDQPFQGPISVMGKGNNGLAEMKKSLNNAGVQWAVFRDNGRILLVHLVPEQTPKSQLTAVQTMGKSIAT